jgi:hypothetical protein
LGCLCCFIHSELSIVLKTKEFFFYKERRKTIKIKNKDAINREDSETTEVDGKGAILQSPEVVQTVIKPPIRI